MTDNKHINYSMLAFISLIVLFRIAYSEIQPWDEGLYAMRAKAVNVYGDFWDQTNHSIGGLYSSTYPPLTIWVIAGSMRVFGESAFAVRLFSALASIISIFVLYNISRRIVSEDKAVFVSILLAGTTIWNQYARQGMTDVPLVLFILLSLLSLMKFDESESKKDKLVWAFGFALFFGLGLMTKIIVSLIPLLFILFFYLKRGSGRKSLMIFAVLIGFGIALPWHLYMAQTHGWEFTKAFFAPHLYNSVENNISYLGPLYYFNQLIISNPFIILTLIFSAIYIIYFKKVQKGYDANLKFYINLSAVWFISGLIVFSFSPTKLAHYLLYILPPALILSAVFYENRSSLVKNQKVNWLITCALLISSLWSFGWIIRQDLKLLKDFTFTNYSALFIAIILLSILSLFLIKSESLKWLSKNLFSKLSIILVIFVVIRIMMLNSFVNPGEINGAVKTSWILRDVDDSSFVYLYHEHNASDSLNPQLAWYTQGWTCGWRKGKSMKSVPMPEKTIDIGTINSLDTIPRQLVVYYLPQNKYLAESTARLILETRILLDQSGRYLIFGKKRKDRKKGMEI